MVQQCQIASSIFDVDKLCDAYMHLEYEFPLSIITSSLMNSPTPPLPLPYIPSSHIKL